MSQPECSPPGSKSPCANSAVFLCFCPSSNRLECPCTWLENSVVFLCFRAPPNRLECLSTSTEIALREFRSFLWFRAPSKSAGVCPPTWLEIALHEFFPFFVFSRTLQSARVSFHLARNRLARIRGYIFDVQEVAVANGTRHPTTTIGRSCLVGHSN